VLIRFACQRTLPSLTSSATSSPVPLPIKRNRTAAVVLLQVDALTHAAGRRSSSLLAGCSPMRESTSTR
jgi:hypothetical protein